MVTEFPYQPPEGSIAAALLPILESGYCVEIRPAAPGQLESGYAAAIALIRALGWPIRRYPWKDEAGTTVALIYEMELLEPPDWALIERPVIRLDEKVWSKAVPIS